MVRARANSLLDSDRLARGMTNGKEQYHAAGTMMPPAVRPPSSDPCDIYAAETFERWLEVSLCGVFDRWVDRCRTCEFRQIRPRLPRDELTALYPAEYFDQSDQIGYLDYAREAQRLVREAYFLLALVQRHGRAARVLEVGCALGFLLSALRAAGCLVDGVDASAFAAVYARRRLHLPVVCGTLEDTKFSDERFDFVVQKDLLEHTLHPRQHLIETNRVIRPGAELWLVTPSGEANLRPSSSGGGGLTIWARPFRCLTKAICRSSHSASFDGSSTSVGSRLPVRARSGCCQGSLGFPD